jgi:hypothetical protein
MEQTGQSMHMHPLIIMTTINGTDTIKTFGGKVSSTIFGIYELSWTKVNAGFLRQQ